METLFCETFTNETFTQNDTKLFCSSKQTHGFLYFQPINRELKNDH